MKKIYIISERIKDKSSYSDGLILTEKDFDPCKSFFEVHPNIKPESIDYIYTKGILEDFEYLRCFLKNIPVVLLSYKDSPNDIKTGMQAGATLYLSKNTLNTQEFAKALRGLLPPQ